MSHCRHTISWKKRKRYQKRLPLTFRLCAKLRIDIQIIIIGLNLRILEVDGSALPTGLNDYVAQQLDSSLDWNDLGKFDFYSFCINGEAWLKSITKLPVLVKGVHSPEVCRFHSNVIAIRMQFSLSIMVHLIEFSCLNLGASGIIVSNHGARQLDTVPATIGTFYL